jgi:poly(A) polymerase
MKHIATINKEFLKNWWDRLTRLNQEKYLKSHPNSELRRTLKATKEQESVKLLESIVKKSPFRNKSFLAGGYVRDEILGRPSKDIDITVAEFDGGIKLAEYIAKQLDIREPVVFPTFGTAKIQLKNGVEVEFVQTRNEEYVQGSRKPETSYGTIQEDVERRDFTINTLLKDLTTGKILDLTGKGLQDLKDGIIRTPLDPDITFNEDSLRMMRCVRFSTKYNFKLADNIIPALQKNAHELQSISKERIRDELDKILLTKRPSIGMNLLKDTGLLKEFMPELLRLVGLEQGRHHYTDAWNHTMDVLDHTPPDLLTRLGALLHDVGKPDTKSVTETGDVHFYKHDMESARIAKDVLTRMKYPNDMIDNVSKLADSHMKTIAVDNWNNPAIRRFVRDMGDLLPNVLDLTKADRKAHKGADLESFDRFIGRIEQLKKEAPIQTMKLPITGNEIMQILNIKQGPAIGKIVNFLNEKQLENPLMTKEEAVKLVKDNF